MKCLHCDSEWKKNSASITKCPFCGENPQVREDQQSFENSKDALAAIYKKFGADVLLGDKLKAYFSDFMPSASRSIKKLIISVYDSGASKILKQNINSSQEDKERAVKIAVRNLTEDFIAPEIAENIVYEFVCALGWQIKKSEPEKIEAKNIPTSPSPLPTPSNKIPANFVHIKGGTFMMGSPANESGHYSSEETQHQVTVSSFYMCKFTVTQKEYREVMGVNPSEFKGDNLPVECVSWFDAIEYCNKLSQREGLTPAYIIDNNKTVTWNRIANGSLEISGYRLPTEAEWEYACRAGTTTAYNTGADFIDNTGWFNNNSGRTTHPVGKKPANAWGLFDMHGNVWEWCWDWYGNYPSGVQTDPTGVVSSTSRVVRGGSWMLSACSTRSAKRNALNPDVRHNAFGFRVALLSSAVYFIN